jgi:hypothetical protein
MYTRSKLFRLASDEIVEKIYDISYEWAQEDNLYLMDMYRLKSISHIDQRGRWNYPVEVILKIETINYGIRYFRTGYDEGLTERQDREIWDARPVEVRRMTKVITKEIEYWEEI